MRVARYYTKYDVRIEETPVPKIGAGEILVKVAACGVCGSDVMDWYTQKKAPAVLGHEPAGTVIAVGEGVTDFKEGDRVFMHHHVPCFVCHFCRRGFYSNCQTFRQTHLDPGGFAEFVRVPALNVQRDVLKLPDDMSWDVATFIEPLGTIIRGVQRSRLQQGDSVAIVGAGLTGLLFTQLARLWGSTCLAAFDLQDWRLSYAQRAGADRVVNPQREDAVACVHDMTEGRGADVVFVCAATIPALEQGVRLAAPGGTIMIFAPPPPEARLAVSPHDILFSELTITGTYSTAPGETRLALDLLASRRVRVEELITHRLGLEDVKRGLDLTRDATQSLKVLIEIR
jgi:L-iditol 2-dehydrogenase